MCTYTQHTEECFKSFSYGKEVQHVCCMSHEMNMWHHAKCHLVQCFCLYHSLYDLNKRAGSMLGPGCVLNYSQPTCIVRGLPPSDIQQACLEGEQVLPNRICSLKKYILPWRMFVTVTQHLLESPALKEITQEYLLEHPDTENTFMQTQYNFKTCRYFAIALSQIASSNGCWMEETK